MHHTTLASHLSIPRHNFHFSKLKILNKEQNLEKILILEMIEILIKKIQLTTGQIYI